MMDRYSTMTIWELHQELQKIHEELSRRMGPPDEIERLGALIRAMAQRRSNLPENGDVPLENPPNRPRDLYKKLGN